jgi:two-component system sensor histidine kinase KdpD
MLEIPKNTVFRIILCASIVLLFSAICFSLQQYLNYSIVAIILLFTVSIFAVIFDIIPVVFAATLSALILNYFFIPPLYTLHIDSSNDVMLFLIFYIICLVNAFLTYKIRIAQEESRDKEEKEKTIQLYNTLLSSLSHELRTPLATITASVDTLNCAPNNLTVDQQHILLNEIEIASSRLNEQVENLLNMSRLDSGMLSLRPVWCDVNEIINHVIGLWSHATHHKFEFNEDNNLPIILIDEGILLQILQNLVKNAIVHTSQNTTIELRVNIDEEHFLYIRVIDNGQGLPAEELPKLFDKFYRVPNSAKGGAGLGLSIVKGYISSMKGTINVGHNEPAGLVFEIKLPVEVSYINKLKNE